MADEVRSHDIVRFIWGLSPVYDHVQVNGELCARSLVDGTLVCPHVDQDETENDEQHRVLVRWQGDTARSTIENGDHLAALAVWKYAQFRAEAGMVLDVESEVKRLNAHYEHQTGGTLSTVFHHPDDERFKAIKKLLAMLYSPFYWLVRMVALKLGATG